MPESSRESAPRVTPERGGRGSGQGIGRRRRYAGRDLTKGSIPGNLWYLSWPQVVESFLSVIDHVADLVWAGRIGFQAIAGLGVAQSFLMMLMTARMGLDAGMRSMISRAVGARKIAYANHVLLQSLTLTTLYSVLLVIVGMALTEPLIRLMGVGDEVVSQAAGYMRFQLFAMSMMGLQRLAGGALQAAGDSITPLKAVSASRVVHLVLSPFLIFGWWWFPSLDLAGAGAANLIAQTIGVTMNMSALIRGTSRLKLSFKDYYVDYPMIWQILKIGIPASVTGAQRAVSQLIVVFIVAPFGEGALAAFALSRRAENTVNHASPGDGQGRWRAGRAEPGRRAEVQSQAVGRVGASLRRDRQSARGGDIPCVPGQHLVVLQLRPRLRRAGSDLAPGARCGVLFHERGAGLYAGFQHDGRHVRAHGDHAVDDVAGRDSAGVRPG